MSFVALLSLLLNVSMGLVVLGFGLHASLSSATYLLTRPELLGRSMLSMYVVMPFVAVAAASLFEMTPPVKIALVVIALSPVPPFLPKLQTGAGGNQDYIVSLLAVAALLSGVVVPAGVLLIGAIFGTHSHVAASDVFPVVLITVLIPLLVGGLLRQFAPGFADRIAAPVALVGTGLMLIALLPILYSQWGNLGEAIGEGKLLTLAAFSLVGIVVGHVLGGHDPERRVLALATGTRHPGVALAIATAIFPQQTAVLAVVFWHVALGGLLSLGYVYLRHRLDVRPAKEVVTSGTRRGAG